MYVFRDCWLYKVISDVNFIICFLLLQVPCDVVFSVKPISSRSSARWHDVYEVEPQRAAIQPHSFVYATVTFQPPSMQVSAKHLPSLVFLCGGERNWLMLGFRVGPESVEKGLV